MHITVKPHESCAAGSACQTAMRSKPVTNSSYLIARFHTTTPGLCQENWIVRILAAVVEERRFTKARVIALRSRHQAEETWACAPHGATALPPSESAHSSPHQHTDTHTWQEEQERAHTQAHPNSSLNSSLQFRLHVTEQDWTPNGECSCHVRPFKPLYRNSFKN